MSELAPETPTSERSRIGFGLGLSVIVAVVAAALLLAQSRLINGSDFWRWAYHRDPLHLGWVALAGIVVTGLCGLALRMQNRGKRGDIAGGLVMLGIAAVLLRFSTAWLFSHEITLRFIDYVVRNPVVGSYFSVAERIAGRDDVLVKYPEWMAFMPLHAMNKPPGLTLFNTIFINALGNRDDQQTAAMVGLACGLLSLACIPLMYAFVRSLGGSATAGFHAAALWALSPGAAIFFALFDPLLTVPALALAVTWIHALRTDRYRWSIAMGCILAATLFFTFNILPIGLFLAAIGWFVASAPWKARLSRFIRHAAVVVVIAALLHIAFGLITGFNLIATLKAALANQAKLLEQIPRPYPATIWWDLIDYALGVAWVPVVLAGVYLTRVRKPLPLIQIAVIIGLAQLLVTAITALLPGETSRVWNFLIPLILLPAALELERWPHWLPVIVYGLMATLTALLSRSLVFMYAG